MSKMDIGNFQKVLIPMIRHVMPTILAQSLVNVQPMTMEDIPDEHLIGECPFKFDRYTKETTAYWVNPKLPRRADRHASNMEMHNWCVKIFGPPDILHPHIGIRWTKDGRKYCFRKKSDRTIFLLRWS